MYEILRPVTYKQLFFLVDTPQKADNTQQKICFVYSSINFILFSFSQKFSYFVFGYPWMPFHFFSSLAPRIATRLCLETRLIDGLFHMQPLFQSNTLLFNLVSKQNFQIWSAAVGHEELAARLEPIRNRKIFWMNIIIYKGYPVRKMSFAQR